MRLAGQIRGGFYAAAPDAVSMVRDLLSRPIDGECLILDPCAGTAAALTQLTHGLGGVPYAVELAEDRAESVCDAVPDGQVLAPADFLGCRISPGTFSLIWNNPPFDHAGGGGGRVEHQFLQAATPLLAPGGVMALVCPELVGSMPSTLGFFDEHFEDLSALPFPEHCRNYDEVVILGRKRKKPDDERGGCWGLWEEIFNKPLEYRLPAGRRPVQWIKWEPTDLEVTRALRTSPVRFMLERTSEEIPRARPPMSPGDGHRAMLLASGFLDGLISPDDEPPHVIRGSVTKETYLSSQHSTEDDQGNVTTRTTYSEKPRLVIRTLDHEGNLKTLMQE